MQRPGFGTRQLMAVIATTVVLLASGVVFASPVLAFGSPTPTPIPSVSAGGYMTCGVRADNVAACWGDNVSEGPGQATPPTGGNSSISFLEVNAGYAHACGIQAIQSTVACWGANGSGQSTPLAGTFTHVVAGFANSCGLRSDGTIACWGSNADGESTPPMGNFNQLTLGIRHGCALAASITCWGSDTYGQVSETPTTGSYTQITSGNFDNCAIRTDSMVVCWGRNAFGQANVPAGTPFKQVSAGFGHVCGIRSVNDTLECWGRNDEGQASPPAGAYKTISAGTFHSCAIRMDNAVVCWGNNAAGRVQPNLSTTAPPGADVGIAYSFQFDMTTYLAPRPAFQVTSGTLPPGLNLSFPGLLSGTPTTPGSYSFTVAATNSLSPPECRGVATGTLPCTPGDQTSVATATRAFVVVVGGTGTTTTTIAPTTTTTMVMPTTTTTVVPPTTTTTVVPPTTTTTVVPPTTTTTAPPAGNTTLVCSMMGRGGGGGGRAGGDGGGSGRGGVGGGSGHGGSAHGGHHGHPGHPVHGGPGGRPNPRMGDLQCTVSDPDGLRQLIVVDLETRDRELRQNFRCREPLTTSYSFVIANDGNDHRVEVRDCNNQSRNFVVDPDGNIDGAPPPPPPPVPVACGETITVSVRLAGDVGPCVTNGIIIGANNITLDLNGFRVFGASAAGDQAGVIMTNRTGVTVKNGTVEGFNAGVAIQRGGSNTVSGIAANNNVGEGGDMGDGIVMDESNDNQILNNTASGNGPYSGVGFTQTTNLRNVIRGNTVTANSGGQVHGIRLEPGSAFTVVTGNLVTGSALEGIGIFARSTDNTVTGNVVRNNGRSGIRAFRTADRNVISDNEVFDNASTGIQIDSTGNTITGNSTGGNGGFDLLDASPTCAGNIWRDNTGTGSPACTGGVVPPPLPVPVACGETVMVSVRLAGNVGPCTANGIIAGADNITIDLNGFTVSGSTAAAGEGAGVLVAGRTGVKVTNGTVTGFDGGVVIRNGSANTVDGIVATKNLGAVRSLPPVAGILYGDGIAILGSSGNRIINSTASMNGPFSGIGLYEQPDSEHPGNWGAPTANNLVENNTVTDNKECRAAGSCDNDGIRIEPRVSPGNRIIGNRVTGSGLDGIAIFGFTSGVFVSGNTVSGNGAQGSAPGDGIRVFGFDNEIVDNIVSGNSGDGISVGRRRAAGSGALPSPNGMGNMIARNTVTSTAGSTFIDLWDSTPNCGTNTWVNNIFTTATPAACIN